MRATYHQDTNVAELTHTQWPFATALTLVSQPSASTGAYAAARHSRSQYGMLHVLRELASTPDKASQRLGVIQAYGHASVADLGNVLVSLENIPALDAMWLFNVMPTLYGDIHGEADGEEAPLFAGQEQSTRYIDLAAGRTIQPPPGMATDAADAYRRHMALCLAGYDAVHVAARTELAEYFDIDTSSVAERGALTARALDVARYLLPTGLLINAAIRTSARTWASTIGLAHASTRPPLAAIGDLLHNLLVGTPDLERQGYKPEAAELVRYVDANLSRHITANQLIECVRSTTLLTPLLPTSMPTVLMGSDLRPMPTLLRHAASLIGSMPMFASLREAETMDRLALLVGDIINQHHNHYNPPGPIAGGGQIGFTGTADIGTLKDLNRHRSLDRWLPWLQDGFDVLGFTKSSPRLAQHPYLREIPTLRATYQHWATQIYLSLHQLAEEYGAPLTEAGMLSYCWSHGLPVNYSIYGNTDKLMYTMWLRTRPGGHLSYRELTWQWLKHLADIEPLFNELLAEVTKPDSTSRSQFVDRG